MNNKSVYMTFGDPYFRSSKTLTEGMLRVKYPVVDSKNIDQALIELKAKASAVFSTRTGEDIRDSLNRVDMHFSRMSPEKKRELVNKIWKTSGFSKHDIENYGLGLFRLLVEYDRSQAGVFVEKALKSPAVIQTANGYLKRFGMMNPLIRWQEPSLLSHFVSGNVVGYTSILVRMGFPIRHGGAAQIFKIPSASAFFPMLYLDQIETVDSELRQTIAAGYWKGGEREVENAILSNSDAVNALGSESTIRDLGNRIRKYCPKAVYLDHGHKVGIAYISNIFLEDRDLCEIVLNGLVRDICAFDGGACYTPKNIYVQGDAQSFAQRLFEKMIDFGRKTSPVSKNALSAARDLGEIYSGCSDVLISDNGLAVVRTGNKAHFWMPDALFRYVKVMPVKTADEVSDLLKANRPYLQMAVVAIPDSEIIPLLRMFGRAGISNLHYPGSAAFLNVYEEPHDSEFDFIKIRYPYRVRFTSTNFKVNKDWLH